MILFLLCALAFAHHDAAVGRVGGEGAPVGVISQEVPGPRVDLGLGLDLVDLRRTLRGSEAYAAKLGSATVTLLSPAVGFTSRRGSSLQVALPLGLIRTQPDGQDASSGVGLGDLRVMLAQRVGGQGGRPYGFARAGLTAPTGRFAEEAALSGTDVTGQDDGTLRVTTYDLRASLGAGAWTARAGLGGGLEVGKTRLSAEAAAGLPVTRTPDGIRWGADLAARATAALPAGPLLASLTGDVRRHDKDNVPGLDEETGELVRASLGGRTSVGLEAALSVQAERTTCRVRARVPLWQQVGGVQLGESIELGAQCAWAISLKRDLSGASR